jgi:hypothetical protein
MDKKGNKGVSSKTLSTVREEMSMPRMPRSVRLAELKLHTARIAEQLSKSPVIGKHVEDVRDREG